MGAGMSTILFGECATENLFEIWDADSALEGEFELIVAKALMCVYPRYHCFPFTGSFKLEDSVSRPDIALVARAGMGDVAHRTARGCGGAHATNISKRGRTRSRSSAGTSL